MKPISIFQIDRDFKLISRMCKELDIPMKIIPRKSIDSPYDGIHYEFIIPNEKKKQVINYLYSVGSKAANEWVDFLSENKNSSLCLIKEAEDFLKEEQIKPKIVTKLEANS